MLAEVLDRYQRSIQIFANKSRNTLSRRTSDDFNRGLLKKRKGTCSHAAGDDDSHAVDLPPNLRQTVKTRFSANGELSHGYFA